jgi:hypothetical protein
MNSIYHGSGYSLVGNSLTPSKAIVRTPKSGTFVNRFELANAMFNRTPINVDGVICLISAIECEDGSGHSFNVQLYINSKSYTIHLKG